MTVKRTIAGPGRLIVVVVDRHEQLVLDFGGFSADLTVDIDIAVDYLDALTRKAD